LGGGQSGQGGEVACRRHRCRSRKFKTIAPGRSSFAIGKVTEDIIVTQQAVADRFYRLGLIPRPIVIRDAVWAGAQS